VLGAAAKRSCWRSLGLSLGSSFGGASARKRKHSGRSPQGFPRARPLVAPAPNEKITAARCIQTRTTDARANVDSEVGRRRAATRPSCAERPPDQGCGSLGPL